jgi:hypothetical protein
LINKAAPADIPITLLLSRRTPVQVPLEALEHSSKLPYENYSAKLQDMNYE